EYSCEIAAQAGGTNSSCVDRAFLVESTSKSPSGVPPARSIYYIFKLKPIILGMAENIGVTQL
ncbi:MAG: hypothetical protein PHU08_03625, partial [Dehalococcoidales bacterium]|nr:hypothetical protein [Dehalococcoidales bacterium]